MSGTVEVTLIVKTTKGRELKAPVDLEVVGGHIECGGGPYGDTYANCEYFEFYDYEIQDAVDELNVDDDIVLDRFIDDLDEDEDLVEIIGWE